MRRAPRLTIRRRLTLWYTALLAVMLLLFGASLYWLLARSLALQVDNSLIAAATQASNALEFEEGRWHLHDPQTPPPPFRLEGHNLMIRLIAPDGAIMEAPVGTEVIPTLVTEPGFGPGFATADVAGDPLAVRLYSLPFQPDGQLVGMVQVAQSLEPVENTLAQFFLMLVLIAPVLLLGAAVGGSFLARRALAPIDQMTRQVRRISAEDLSQRLGLPPPHDEVGRLAATFDGMLDRLEHAFVQQRQFAADASHELRTPLAGIQGLIDVALTRPRDAAAYRGTLTDVATETARMARIVHDLLLLARGDAGQLPMSREPCNLADLVDTALEIVRPLADARHHTLHAAAGPAVWVDGDPDGLVRVLINLLDNAVRYTADGGRIQVAIACEGAAGVVAVTDTGRGIAAANLPHIFDRFYRVDRARSRQTGGSGLGLAIVQHIVAAHAGTVAVESTLGHGSRFVVAIPLATDWPGKFM